MTETKQRVNKSKKRNWKHVDIQDIEDNLEDQRLQERTGGLVAEKTDDQLFFIDNSVTDKGDVSLVGKKRRRDVKNLKCHSGLLPDPKIKPGRVKHHNGNINGVKELCKDAQELLDSGEIFTSNQKQAMQQSRTDANKNKQKRFQKNKPNIASYDLWGDESSSKNAIQEAAVAAISVNEFTNEATAHFLTVTKKQRVKVPKHHKIAPSSLPAVEIAHAGQSYNPDFDKYQELLASAHNFEVVKTQKEDQITRALEDQFPDASTAPTQESYIEEMSQGLFDAAEEPETAPNPDPESLSVNPPIRRENKKTITQRNKEKRRRLAEEKLKKEKAKKAKKNEIQRLKAMKKDIVKDNLEKAETAEHKAKLKEKFKDKPKILGRLKYEAPDIEVKLAEELQPTLRQLKPEGHLLDDRFKSLQRRNIIEPRKRAKRTHKYKLKYFDNKSHRNVPGCT